MANGYDPVELNKPYIFRESPLDPVVCTYTFTAASVPTTQNNHPYTLCNFWFNAITHKTGPTGPYAPGQWPNEIWGLYNGEPMFGLISGYVNWTYVADSVTTYGRWTISGGNVITTIFSGPQPTTASPISEGGPSNNGPDGRGGAEEP